MRHDLTSKLVQILGGDLDHRILPFIEVVGIEWIKGAFSA